MGAADRVPYDHVLHHLVQIYVQRSYGLWQAEEVPYDEVRLLLALPLCCQSMMHVEPSAPALLIWPDTRSAVSLCPASAPGD